MGIEESEEQEPAHNSLDGERSFIETLKEVVDHFLGVPGAPGCHIDSLPHPTQENGCVRVALVDKHRFAFASWVNWRHEEIEKLKLGGWNGEETDLRSPTLVSLDRHNDVGCPEDYCAEDLSHLDKGDENLLGLFSWICLPGNNDGHILPAAYLNAISDVHVLLKELGSQPDLLNREHKDHEGQPHRIRYYAAIDTLVKGIEEADPRDVILDIDLDFFTEELPSIKRVSDKTIKETLAPGGPLMSILLPRLKGITIALEPEHCGGIGNAFHILGVIDKLLFSPGLFSDRCKWRHCSERA